MANELNQNTETNTNNGKENTAVENKETGNDIASLQEQIKKLEAENGKLRKANTNASADASKWKKQYQERLSEEDRKKEEQAEAEATLRQEVETLRKERNVANHKSELISIGFEDALATDVATALNDGDTGKVFDGLRKFITAHDKAIKESAFRNNPTLPGGNATKTVTKEQFAKMGYKERLEIYNTQPELYKELTK